MYTYKIILTICIIIKYAKRSFSKLNLLKYFISTVSQYRLNNLVLIYIENN